MNFRLLLPILALSAIASVAAVPPGGGPLPEPTLPACGVWLNDTTDFEYAVKRTSTDCDSETGLDDDYKYKRLVTTKHFKDGEKFFCQEWKYVGCTFDIGKSTLPDCPKHNCSAQ